MRAAFYIDGFNLYHKIAAVPSAKNPNKKLRWLDLRALAEKLRFSRAEEITAVYYFSAYAEWLPPEARQRHKTYVRALQSRGVSVILGNFKQKDAHCPSCRHGWKKHEEKESDVNLALQLVSDAYEDRFDRAYILSADSDMIPAMRMVKAKFPHKELCAVFPPQSRWTADIRAAADSNKKITEKLLSVSLLSPEIYDSSGKALARCPQAWR